MIVQVLSVAFVQRQNGPSYLSKRSLDKAQKFGTFVMENKGMSPVLGIAMLVITRSYCGFKKHFSDIINGHLAESELGMI